MCGIAGFTRFYQPWGDKTLLKSMGDSIRHRGPDAHGEFLNEQVGLCHRRLSIIDLSDAANQPFHDEDHGLSLVFNGEIYNFPELRKTFKQQGYVFHTDSDTEVILAAYHFHGHDCVKHLNGMFAFALWDAKQQTLFCARDRLGKKPFYYAYQNGDIVFASELKVLLEHNLVEKNLRSDALMDYFIYQYVPDPKTILDNVYKLEPGHHMTVSHNGFRTQCYWRPSYGADASITEQDATDNLSALIRQCTEDRMISDVPIGAFLSGGVDSSGIVACMSQHSSTPVTTCSIGFDEEAFNETEFAATVAKQYKTDHHEYSASQGVEQTLLRVMPFFDEPFADPSLVPTFLVCELAKQSVTVALAGDGGDEMFAGYQKYTDDDREQQLRRYLPNLLRKKGLPALSGLARSFSMPAGQRLANLLDSVAADPDQGFFITNSQCSENQWRQLAQPTLQGHVSDYDPSELTRKHYHECDGEDHLSKILYTDLKTYLPGNILVKVDRTSMAHALEVRAPLLDYRIAEFAAQLPSQLKYQNGEKKYILKRVFQPLLPHDILYRKKMGFTPPLSQWLRKDLKPLFERMVLNPNSAVNQYFDVKTVSHFWGMHRDLKADYAHLLWTLLIFELWWHFHIAGRNADALRA